MAIPLTRALARYLDPRRSLASAIGWLIFALSISLVLFASAWVGSIVRTNLLDLRARHLERAAAAIADELNLGFALRLQSARTLAAILATELRAENKSTLRKILGNLQQAYPEFETIVVADANGRTLASIQAGVEAMSVEDRALIVPGLKEARIGDVQVVPMTRKASPGASGNAHGTVIALNASVIDAKGDTVGVIQTQLSQRWLLELAVNLAEKLRQSEGAEALLLDENDRVLIGPASFKGKRWEGTRESMDTAASALGINVPGGSDKWASHVERLVDGRRFLVALAAPSASATLHPLGWRVVVLQPLQDASRHAGVLQIKIVIILLGLGLLAALLGILAVRRVTRDLGAIARSADAVRAGTTQNIAVPSGRSEAARLGRALDLLFTSLQRERRALQVLNAELDQRVAARTREVERLAGEARYAAVVRERLKIARDLHDTLAHSMMAMLAEIRLLKRLSTADPAGMAKELSRAEETAHQGLKEVRAAITQMRFNPVRDAGLAAALGDLVKSFAERTGIAVDYTSDAPPGTFTDERAETLFRIAEEALRNVERHAGAMRVAIALHALGEGHGLTLTIADDGAGFDAEAAHPGHYGLTGLREQAQLIGAVLTIRSAPQQGTKVSVMLAPGLDA